jgi:hypothetical protein
MNSERALGKFIYRSREGNAFGKYDIGKGQRATCNTE